MSATETDSPVLPVRRVARWAGMLLGLACLCWAAGFAWFVRSAMQNPAVPPSADGIVALTGGADRIETALHLLLAGRARLLLVSGVSRAADLGELTHRIGLDPAAIAPRVTLG